MTSGAGAKQFEILLVEDNPGDVRLIQEALNSSEFSSNLTVAVDGEEAMAVLRMEGEHADAPSPDLVLLDLNLPKKPGQEVLAEIKEDPQLKRIPVVVLTSSQAETDVLSSYNLQANSYVNKPVDVGQFNTVIQRVQAYWLAISRLPQSMR